MVAEAHLSLSNRHELSLPTVQQTVGLWSCLNARFKAMMWMPVQCA